MFGVGKVRVLEFRARESFGERGGQEREKVSRQENLACDKVRILGDLRRIYRHNIFKIRYLQRLKILSKNNRLTKRKISTFTDPRCNSIFYPVFRARD